MVTHTCSTKATSGAPGARQRRRTHAVRLKFWNLAKIPKSYHFDVNRSPRWLGVSTRDLEGGLGHTMRMCPGYIGGSHVAKS